MYSKHIFFINQRRKPRTCGAIRTTHNTNNFVGRRGRGDKKITQGRGTPPHKVLKNLVGIESYALAKAKWCPHIEVQGYADELISVQQDPKFKIQRNHVHELAHIVSSQESSDGGNPLFWDTFGNHDIS